MVKSMAARFEQKNSLQNVVTPTQLKTRKTLITLRRGREGSNFEVLHTRLLLLLVPDAVIHVRFELLRCIHIHNMCIQAPMFVCIHIYYMCIHIHNMCIQAPMFLCIHIYDICIHIHNMCIQAPVFVSFFFGVKDLARTHPDFVQVCMCVCVCVCVRARARIDNDVDVYTYRYV
jgi:hypothetical protein